MGLRQGDRITIRRSARVQLTQYDSLTPSVSISRELGEDPDADRADLERIAYVELRRAVIEELLTRRKFDALLGDDTNLTSLLTHCEKVVRIGYDKGKAGLGLVPGTRETQDIRSDRTRTKNRKARKAE